jgi:hypothetical protein
MSDMANEVQVRHISNRPYALSAYLAHQGISPA